MKSILFFLFSSFLVSAEKDTTIYSRHCDLLLQPGVYDFSLRVREDSVVYFISTVYAPPIIEGVRKMQPSSIHAKDGELAISVREGSGRIISYEWNNKEDDDRVENLSGGSYKAIVTDENGCKDSIKVELFYFSAKFVGGKIEIEYRGNDEEWRENGNNAYLTISTPSGQILHYRNIKLNSYSYYKEIDFDYRGLLYVSLSTPRGKETVQLFLK